MKFLSLGFGKKPTKKSGDYQEEKAKDSLISKIMKVSVGLFIFLAMINLTIMSFLQ